MGEILWRRKIRRRRKHQLGVLSEHNKCQRRSSPHRNFPFPLKQERQKEVIIKKENLILKTRHLKSQKMIFHRTSNRMAQHLLQWKEFPLTNQRQLVALQVLQLWFQLSSRFSDVPSSGSGTTYHLAKWLPGVVACCVVFVLILTSNICCTSTNTTVLQTYCSRIDNKERKIPFLP